VATTAFVMAAILAGGGVSTFNGRAGAVTLTANDVEAAGGPYAPTSSVGLRNRIINGDFSVDQRHGGASVAMATTNLYVIDRWMLTNALGTPSKGASAQSPITSLLGFQFCWNFNVTVAYPTPAAGDEISLFQIIEGVNFNDALWGTANAQAVVLEFWAAATVAGTYSFVLQTPDGTRSYVGTFALPAGGVWTKIRTTIPGDTSGTWAVASNGAAALLSFSLCSGSTFQTSTVNAWQSGNYKAATGSQNVLASVSNGYNVTGVGITVGALAVSGGAASFKCFSDNLIDCQRYYEKSYPEGVVAGAPGSVTAPGMVMIFAQGFSGAIPVAGGTSVNFKTVKRATPTLSIFSAVSGAAGVMRDRVSNVDVAVSPSPVIGDANFTAWASMSVLGTAVNLGFQWTADADF
jgi:hypothetical protein